jgi:dTMP kinase
VKHRRKGLLITLEGGEGTGKTTQAQALGSYLKRRGFPVTVTREPQGTELGRALWQHIVDGGLSPQAELFLILAARAQHVSEVVRPALERGDVVISDRFTDSTLAYQGYGRGLDLAGLERLNDITTQGLRPDFTVLFDLPVKKGLARAEGRAGEQGKARVRRERKEPPQDSIGGESAEFHERVRRGYLALAAREPKRWLIADATMSPSEMSGYIMGHLDQFLSASGRRP